MSANRIFLVCSHHPKLEEALLLAERPDAAEAYATGLPKRADAWFIKHSLCARGCDHFQLAFQRPPNWDVSPPAEPVANGVRLALVTGSGEETKQ